MNSILRSFTSFSVAVTLTALALSTFFCSGCRFGSAQFSNDFDDLNYSPNGTVFAYVDAHDALNAPVDEPRVVLVATWLVFNAQKDLSDLSGRELEDLSHEFELREALSLIFDRERDVDDRVDFSWTQQGALRSDNAEAILNLQLPPERLNSNSRYASFIPYASKKEINVRIDEASLAVGGILKGSMTVQMRRAETDPSNAKTGTLEIQFSAPIIDESIAERNLAALNAQKSLGLPWIAP